MIRGILKLIFKGINRGRSDSLSKNIQRCMLAMQLREDRMLELWHSVDYPGMDEHIAALGGDNSEYRCLADKQERAGAWLIVLLKKRGTPEDLRLAEAIRIGAWP